MLQTAGSEEAKERRRRKRSSWAPAWRDDDVGTEDQDRQDRCLRGKHPISYARRTWPHIMANG